MFHEPRILQQSLDAVVQREVACVQRGTVASKTAVATHGVQIVRQSHAVTAGDLEDFVLAIRIEGGPTDGTVIDFILGCTPVEAEVPALVTDHELAALVVDRETDDQ